MPFQERSNFVGRTRSRRQDPEERLPTQLEEIEISPEEVELSDFLDGLGRTEFRRFLYTDYTSAEKQV
jgi:hypothetical protein